MAKCAFACNRDKISSRDKSYSGIKKIWFTRELHLGMKLVEFHPEIKFNFKELLLLRMKAYKNI